MFKARLALIFMTAILLTGCATVPITGRKQLSFIPRSELTALGEDNYRQIVNESKLSTDARKTSMVVRVGEKIAASAERFMRENGMGREIDNYRWEFNLIEEDRTVNAFCLPGGKIAVYTGILPVCQDESGVATVIAHEVTHAIANHGGERLSQAILLQLGEATLESAVEQKPEKTKQLLLTVYGVSANLGFFLPYSRTHEREADYIGLILMAQAGYDPRTAVSFWERMKAQETEKIPEFLSTHPATDKRIEDIRKELPNAMNYYRK